MPEKKKIVEQPKDSEDYASKLSKIIDTLGLEVEEDTDQKKESISEKNNKIIPPKQEEPSISKVAEGESQSSVTVEIEKSTSVKKEEPKTKDDRKTETVLDPIYTPVYLNWKAYKRIVGYGSRYANDKIDQKNWKEVYGILIGTVEENTLVVVKDAIPVCVGGKTGVELEPIHYVDLSQIDASVYERAIDNEKTEFIIGWWHTHPGFGFFFSNVDAITHLGYQVPNPYAVGIIFDHCEKKNDELGVAGLRLTDPDEGVLSEYKQVELHFDSEIEQIKEKVTKVIDKINKNMEKVLKELKYIEDVLRKKAWAQLQRNFGLSLVPKRELKETENEDEAEEDDTLLYVWDPEYLEKKYRIPKFREKIEKDFREAEKDLKMLLKQKETKKFNLKREKYQKSFKIDLEKPNEWYNRLWEDYSKRIEAIYPLYNYLDTEERKTMENLEERLGEYYKILEKLNERTEFNNLLEKKSLKPTT